MKQITLIIVVIGLMAAAASAQDAKTNWVNAQLQAMTIDQKIGQLFTIRAHSDLGEDHIASVRSQIREYHVGGLCFFQGTPLEHAKLINEYQSLSQMPLLISMDAEWGLGMRFRKGVVQYPRPLMLGAIQDNSLLYDLGAEIGRQLRDLGVHLNFAPVADVNNNPSNPVINDRSFGEDKYNVSTKAYMMMRGMQDQGVAACAKHFPGHGDTDVDSHHDLPVITHNRERLDDIELFPFRTLIKHDIKSMMVAHLNLPELEPAGLPTTLSHRVTTDLLRGEMGFKGVIFTDGMEMQAVSGKYPNGVAEVMAFNAGNDVILLPNDLPLAFQSIKEKFTAGEISIERIEASVRRILALKYDSGLHHYRPASLDALASRLNNEQAQDIKQALIRQSLTLVRNNHAQIPFLESYHSYGSLSIGTNTLTDFQLMLDKYDKMPRYFIDHKITAEESKKLVANLARKDVVLISLHDMSKYASKDFGLDVSALRLIQQLSEKTKVVLTVFGSPYSLAFFDHIDHVLMAYNDDEETQRLAAQALFGAVALKGRLPITATALSSFGTGIDTKEHFRIGWGSPAQVGMNSDSLREIDHIMHEIMQRKAAPGAQILVAKKGSIIFEKAYGYHTYAKKKPVQMGQLYDLASVTKITAATLAVMKLYEEGKIDLDTPIDQYLPELKNSNKGKLILRDIMAHHAGLKPWIPFYQYTLDEKTKRPDPDYYKPTSSAEYEVAVTEGMFLRSDYPDSIWHAIIESDLRERRDYRYSDLGFYIIAKVVEEISEQPFSEYLVDHFYGPLNMRKTTFNPLENFERSEIVPTEKDNYFRFTTVHGEVHDMGAAMLNGISGHAGLFSNAEDLAKLYQMLLNKGHYGGRQFLKPETIKTFTTRHPRSTRRALGYDMKELKEKASCNIAEECSSLTFGHYGFTGTAVWVDPTEELIFIFLSNRTYPSMKNNLLFKDNYRSKIQSAIYKSIIRKSDPSQS